MTPETGALSSKGATRHEERQERGDSRLVPLLRARPAAAPSLLFCVQTFVRPRAGRQEVPGEASPVPNPSPELSPGSGRGKGLQERFSLCSPALSWTWNVGGVYRPNHLECFWGVRVERTRKYRGRKGTKVPRDQFVKRIRIRISQKIFMSSLTSRNSTAHRSYPEPWPYTN